MDRPPRRALAAAPESDSSVAVWTSQQVATFLDIVANDRLFAMWWLIALRGLRRGEAAGLRWIDVDLDAKVVMIDQQRIAYGHTVTVGPPKTAASRRTIALDRHHRPDTCAPTAAGSRLNSDAAGPAVAGHRLRVHRPGRAHRCTRTG